MGVAPHLDSWTLRANLQCLPEETYSRLGPSQPHPRGGGAREARGGKGREGGGKGERAEGKESGGPTSSEKEKARNKTKKTKKLPYI